MSAFIYAILTLLALGTGFIAASKISERRSTKTKTLKGRTTAEVTPPATAKSGIQTVAAVPPPGSSATAVTPSQPTTSAAQPIIPDPWLAEAEVMQSELPTTVTAHPVAATVPPSVPVTSSVAVETLVAAIAQAGRSGQLQQLSYVKRYMNHGDSQVRAAVAAALGNLAKNRQGAAVNDLIPLLGNLCQDPNLAVRQVAVAALGNVQSPKVLPLLQQAQKQPNLGISQAAAQALQKLKLTYQPQSARAVSKSAKPVKK